ncbi:N-acetyltransferase family protein [Verrucomicrobiota bacterium sgz303538]
MESAPAQPYTLRPVQVEDMPFLREVYASTRADELALVSWTDEQKAEFCRMQFEAQDKHYREHYPKAQFLIIEHGELPVGRLYVDRWPREIRIMDIALLPEHRSKGIGSVLIRELQQEAQASGKTLSIHVEKFNPALRLYDRLGFRPIEDKGVYHLMVWQSA